MSGTTRCSPRATCDFSPYFAVVKPALARGFDHRRVVWADDGQGTTDGDAMRPGHAEVNGRPASGGNGPGPPAN